MDPSFLVVLFGLWLGANAQCCGEPEACPSCPSGWTEFNDRCYVYEHGAKDWADAEETCLREGGNLVSYRTKEEYEFILKLIRRSSGKETRIWVGYQDATKNGVWLWSDGSKSEFKIWGRGQPDNAKGKEHCLELNFNGFPNDHECHIKKPFMCVKHME